MDWFDLLLLTLASFRLTHLIVFDTIAEPIRQALQNRPFFGPLIECYWCAGVWVSLLLYTAYTLWPAGAKPVAIVLAIAGGQAMLETLAGRE